MKEKFTQGPIRAILAYAPDGTISVDLAKGDLEKGSQNHRMVLFPFDWESLPGVIQKIQENRQITEVEFRDHREFAEDHPDKLEEFYTKLSAIRRPVRVHGVDCDENAAAIGWLMQILQSKQFKRNPFPADGIRERSVPAPRRGLKRKRNGWFHADQIRARRYIIDAKEFDEYTYEQITEKLNGFHGKDALSTVEGGEYQVTTVSRLYQDAIKLIPNFMENKELDEQLDTEVTAGTLRNNSSSREAIEEGSKYKNVPVKVLDILEKDKETNLYGRYLRLRKREELRHPLVFEILDRDGQLCYSKVLLDDTFDAKDEFTVDLIEDMVILPGRYYWKLQDLKNLNTHPASLQLKHLWKDDNHNISYNHKYGDFNFAKELIETDKVRPATDPKSPKKGIFEKVGSVGV